MAAGEKSTEKSTAETGPSSEEVAGGKGLDLDFRAEILRRLTSRGSHDRYRIEGEIARGGQGAILRAWDEDLRRTLAMKVILAMPGSEDDSRALARFLEEAQITGQLDHPGIVPVHEIGLDEQGRVYFTMRLVKGRNLKEIIELVHTRQEGWTLTRALGAMLRMCEAMAYAHRKGVIHRDLKPNNVMVGRFGEVYVMDWGLARVLGHPDGHDLRLRTEQESVSLVANERHGGLHDELMTMDGAAIGTPAYMSPEQARGELDELDARADVYSAGALLYHLLTGQTPYVTPGTKITARQLLWRVIEGPPERLHQLAPSVPAELVAICEKAMARAPERRYRDMAELREDLSAFLEHRVVSAYQTGALAELSKWVQRNRPLAAAVLATILALIGGLAAALVLKAQSDDNAVLASESSKVAERRRDDVLRLSAFQRLEDLKQEAALLWPPLPRLVPLYDAWLERAKKLAAELQPRAEGYLGHHAKLAELEARAEPLDAAQEERLLQSHPLFPAVQELRTKLSDLDRRLAARAGKAPGQGGASANDPAGAAALDELAWPLVDPDRAVFGQEARGLELAQRAFDAIDGDEEFAQASRVLAWALFANGQDDAALKKLEAALDFVPDELRAPLVLARQRLRAELSALDGLARARANLADELAALEQSMGARRSLRFADADDDWWHRQLSKLTLELEAFADPARGLIEGLSPEHGWSIGMRRAFAATIEERSLTGEVARRRWAEACASIADERASPAYRGLVLAPQLGLLPIGRDPDSKLWEFAYLLSGDVPVRGADGRLVPSADSAIVLVLLPGGTFTMGAQARDPSAKGYDPLALPNEGPPHEVQISPFFLAKYELTQGQWLRFTGQNPSQDNPQTYDPAWNSASAPGSLLHPVERVSWNECVEVCRKLGLVLPSEARWEYAARAGTTTPWWTGPARESAEGALNVADSRLAGTGNSPSGDVELWLDDGQVSHAPVGSYRPNPFGLHDILGNVWEWCLDGNDGDFYRRSPRVDPLLEPSMSPLRSGRGGGFSDSIRMARCSQRVDGPPERRDFFLGLRPARSIEP